MAVFGLPDGCTRTTRCGRCAPRPSMQRALRELNASWSATAASRWPTAPASTPARWSPATPASRQRWSPATRSTWPRGSSRPRARARCCSGELTYRLVRDAVDGEPVEPLELKGKARARAGVPAARRRSADGDRARPDAPLVGRERGAGALRGAFDEAAAERRCRARHRARRRRRRQVPPRRASSLRAGRAARACCAAAACRTATASRSGRWSRSCATRPASRADDPPRAARAKLAGAAGDAGEVADGSRRAIGLSRRALPAATRSSWAVAQAPRAARRGRGRWCVVFDDIHWAEPAFLDLLEHLLDASRERADPAALHGARPSCSRAAGLGAARPHATTVSLAPLSGDDGGAGARQPARRGRARPDAARAHRRRRPRATRCSSSRCSSMLIDDGALRREDDGWRRRRRLGDVAVPPTIHALLGGPPRPAAARRARRGRAGVRDRAALPPRRCAELSRRADRASPTALALARKQFIAPDEPRCRTTTRSASTTS